MNNEDLNDEISHKYDDDYERLMCIMEPYYDEIMNTPESCRSAKMEEIAEKIYAECNLFNRDFIFYTIKQTTKKNV